MSLRGASEAILKVHFYLFFCLMMWPEFNIMNRMQRKKQYLCDDVYRG